MSKITNSFDIKEKYLDKEALRKLVYDLKLESLKLQENQEALLVETSIYELSANDLKQKYNIIGAAAEISGWNDHQSREKSKSNNDVKDSEDAVNSNSNSRSKSNKFGSEDDKKWIEANRKLETVVLNEEIRSCLPKLESDALLYESNIFAIEKAALQAIEKQKELPSLLNKTSAELEDEMGITIEARTKIKAKMSRDADARRREKSLMINQVSKLREQLTLLIDECEVVQNSTFHMSLMLSSEETRVKILMDEMNRVRGMFDQYNGGHGFAKEAFRAFCKSRQKATDLEESMDLISEENCISINDVPDSLSKWSSIKVTNEMVKKQMADIRLVDAEKMHLQQYLYLCKCLVENEGL